MDQSGQEASVVAADFRRFLSWVQSAPPPDGETGSTGATAVLRRHLGPDGVATSVVSCEWPAYDHVNLQVACNAWRHAPDRSVEVHGLAMSADHGPAELSRLCHGSASAGLTAPSLIDLPAGPATTLACWRLALLLVTDRRGRYAVLVRGPQGGATAGLLVEVLGLATAAAQDVVAELATLRTELNVHRGQVLQVHSDADGPRLIFVELPTTRREDVILPEDVLRRIERHTVDISARRRALRATRQHLKRGLLLYGPPGTGKTHTARYVMGRMLGSTVVMLTGDSLSRVAAAVAVARELQPAIVLLEDVDLIAEERGSGPAANPVLFELLEAMDGTAGDCDVLFILTTNRAEILERALSQRPGRIDTAVEIALPGPDARLRLLRLYGRSVPLVLDEVDLDAITQRTAGVTASFIKELLRRCVMEALDAQGEPLLAVRAEHVHRALNDMLGTSAALTRTLLGGAQR